jgi:Winged helix-turn-helix DNA-binding
MNLGGRQGWRDLVELARRYVSLSDQLEAVRGEIAKAVLNGGAGEHPVRPMPAGRPGGTGSQHPNATRAAEAEEKILNVLRATPGLSGTRIAKETGTRVNTTTERERRLESRGPIARDAGAGGWTANDAP